MITVAVDVMGGDNAPSAIAEGIRIALLELPDLRVRAYGPKSQIQSLLSEGERLAIFDAPEVITNNEHPTQAIRTKINSSLVQALLAVKEKQADAFVSAGSTGALLAGAVFRVGRIQTVSRPALAPLFPTLKGPPVLVCDIGANMDCKPEYLAQFAAMGCAYMRGVAGVKEPKFALLSVGAEDEKGNELTRAAFELLRGKPGFVGNMEARDVLSGEVSVVVTDGFAGNVFLKSVEGTAGMMMAILKQELSSTFLTKIGAALAKPGLRRMKRKLDYTETGGAPLLGVDGIVVKAHGSSNARAFANAIRQSVRMAEAGLVKEITGQLISIAAAKAGEDQHV